MNENPIPCARNDYFKRGPLTMGRVAYAALILGLLFLVQASADSASDASAIEETYDSWVQVTNAKDINTWSSYLAPSAFFVPPGVQPLETRDDILDYYRASFADPNFALECQQLAVDVAESGEMAWARGTCRATFTDSNGQKANGTSRWFKVWLKQLDGSWKCRINTWNFEGS